MKKQRQQLELFIIGQPHLREAHGDMTPAMRRHTCSVRTTLPGRAYKFVRFHGWFHLYSTENHRNAAHSDANWQALAARPAFK